jgi:hypothetical protein
MTLQMILFIKQAWRGARTPHINLISGEEGRLWNFTPNDYSATLKEERNKGKGEGKR